MTITAVVSPYVTAANLTSFIVNCVIAGGVAADLQLFALSSVDVNWRGPFSATAPQTDVAQFAVTGLSPSTQYTFIIKQISTGADVASGACKTQYLGRDTFRIGVISDTHIDNVAIPGTGSLDWPNMQLGAGVLNANNPDLCIHLGDRIKPTIPNQAASSFASAKQLDLGHRYCMGALASKCPQYLVNGNHDFENGNQLAVNTFGRDARLAYMPGPDASTFPQGGISTQNYYAFTWGCALIIVLDVMSYTPDDHSASNDPNATAENWTLGATQLLWLRAVLAADASPWRLFFAHHAVGGAADNKGDEIYGRGGWRARYIGEQETVHNLVQQYGHIFFYGHDHFFEFSHNDAAYYVQIGSPSRYINTSQRGVSCIDVSHDVVTVHNYDRDTGNEFSTYIMTQADRNSHSPQLGNPSGALRVSGLGAIATTGST
jgi:predicted phosphodiesterase